MKPDQSHIDRWLLARKQQRSNRTHALLLKGLLEGSVSALSQAITLIESNTHEDIQVAQHLLSSLPEPKQTAKRIGITGVPGVGKSTFIEQFGMQLIKAGHKVAVLAIDPSSSRTGGSILGDKTRMEQLSMQPNAFIRPTAAGHTLGGVAQHTRQAIALCEAAGFEIILIETVGVGQSETLVHGMVDFFVLLMLAGAGDELQGIKRGIMELADLIVINKADGDNTALAKAARSEYAAAIHVFAQRPDQWQPRVVCASGLNGTGLDEIWNITESYFNQMQQVGILGEKRQLQELQLFDKLFFEMLHAQFFAKAEYSELYKSIRVAIAEGKIKAYEGQAALQEQMKDNP